MYHDVNNNNNNNNNNMTGVQWRAQQLLPSPAVVRAVHVLRTCAQGGARSHP
jgi:hypothetical protein